MTPTEEFTSRYRQVERVTDKMGRLIGVRRLKVSQQLKVSEMTPALEGFQEFFTEGDKKITIPRRSLPLIAASVCEIDGQAYAFPRSRAELDDMMDKLDEEGLAAAVQASVNLNPNPPEKVAGEDALTGEQETTETAKK